MISGSPVHEGDVAGRMSGHQFSIYSAFIIRAIPKGDEGILANFVALKGRIWEVMSEFRSIYEMKRGITEVRFDDQFEPIKIRIQT